MRISRALVSLPAVALALVLTACGGSDGSDDAGEPRNAFESSSAPADDASDEPTEEPTEEPEEPSTDEPAEGIVTTDLATFAAPEGWAVVTPEEAQAMIDGDRLEENGSDFLDRTGMSAEQMIQLIERFDAIAVSDRGAEGGFFDNVNVSTQPTGITSPELAQQEFAQLGATVQDISNEQIGGQEALVVSYRLPVNGGLEIEGRAVQVAAGTQTVAVTVSAREAAVADDALDRIRETFELVG